MPNTAIGRILLAALLAILAPIISATADSSGERMVVGTANGIPIGPRLPLGSWDAASTAIERDEQTIRACLTDPDCGNDAALRVAELLRSVDNQSREAQLAAVHSFFNRVPYRGEGHSSGPDEWLAPLAFLDRGGDCEDYALAKYAALRLLGFAETSLAVLVVTDRDRGLSHAVLLVTWDNELRVLDNLSQSIGRGLPRHYTARYAVNRVDRWVFAAASDVSTMVALVDTTADGGMAHGVAAAGNTAATTRP